MFPGRLPQRIAHWLALAAMLAAALLPTVSHALAAASGQSGWGEICTPQGLRTVTLGPAAADQDRQAPAETAAGLEHCPYCAPGGTSLGLPPAASVPSLLPQGSGALPPLFLHAPRTPFAWRSAQPRAPPVFA